jgi:hypothetical protein
MLGLIELSSQQAALELYLTQLAVLEQHQSLLSRQMAAKDSLSQLVALRYLQTLLLLQQPL